MTTEAELIEHFVAGSPRALARAISASKSGRGAGIVRQIYGRTGRAMRIGLTGPPGVGKSSTLCGALVRTARAQGKTVGVVSVDPSSPFSHGAMLGDASGSPSTSPTPTSSSGRWPAAAISAASPERRPTRSR